MLSSSTLIISSGVVVLALLLKTSLQSAFDLSFSPSPFFSWLKPVFIINGIIFTLAASWRLHHSEEHNQRYDNDPTNKFGQGNLLSKTVIWALMPEVFDFGTAEFAGTLVYEEETTAAVEVAERGLGERGEEEAGRLALLDNPPETNSLQEKPLVIRRLARQTDTVSRLLDEQNDTMDDAWKMITEAKSTPPSGHVEKSDTWKDWSGQLKAKPCQVTKSERLRDSTNLPNLLARTPTWLKLKKESELSPDEVTRRAETFIKNFNEEMRLQRLESLKRYEERLRREL